MDFDITKILIGSTALGLLAGFWQPIKTFLAKIVSLLIQQVEVPTEQGHDALVAYLISKHKRSGVYDRVFGAWWDYRRDGRYALIPYETFGQRSMIFWNGWTPFIFHNQRERKPAGNEQNRNADATKIYSVLTFIRGTLDLDSLLEGACALRNRQTWDTETSENATRNRFVIHYVPKRGGNGEQEDGPWSTTEGLPWYAQGHYRLIGMTPDELGKTRNGNGKALETLIFPPRVKALLGEIELWRKNRGWYQEKGIPWKRGWLLYGPPGTGKTALARAFAEDLNLPIYVFTLAEMSNHDLLQGVDRNAAERAVHRLIGDIDNVFHGRENIARKNSPMSLSLAAAEEGRRQARRPMQTPLIVRHAAQLPRRRRAFGRDLHDHHDERDHEGRCRSRPAAQVAGRDDRVHLRHALRRIDKASYVELTYMEVGRQEADGSRASLGRLRRGACGDARIRRQVSGPRRDAGPVPGALRPDRPCKRFWAEQEGDAVRRDDPATWIRPTEARRSARPWRAN